jgi:hypothetical protein
MESFGCAVNLPALSGMEIAMNETTLKLQEDAARKQDRSATQEADRKINWETPCMEDVSEQVTAQPYIRFT